MLFPTMSFEDFDVLYETQNRVKHQLRHSDPTRPKSLTRNKDTWFHLYAICLGQLICNL